MLLIRARFLQQESISKRKSYVINARFGCGAKILNPLSLMASVISDFFRFRLGFWEPFGIATVTTAR